MNMEYPVNDPRVAQFHLDYPSLFWPPKNDRQRGRMDGFGFEISNGWLSLLRQTCELMTAYCAEHKLRVRIVGVHESHASLRIDLWHSRDKHPAYRGLTNIVLAACRT
jgi:hypothetical protein